MRVWGRVGQVDGQGGKWTLVQTDANGYNDGCYLTALIQCLKLNLGESPFWGSSGIPAVPSVISQVAPDYYVNLTQQQYAPYFGTLLISKVQTPPNRPKPTYNVNVTTKQGAVLSGPIPT